MPRKAAEEDYVEIYRAAAQEHVALALDMHAAGRYVMAHYLAGLAVECLLRAYPFRISPTFSGRHDLQTLYQEAHFDTIVPIEEAENVSIAMTEVVRRWSNSHRYRSERALRLYLQRAIPGQRGKFVRESSRRIVSAAKVIVDLGVSQWNI